MNLNYKPLLVLVITVFLIGCKNRSQVTVTGKITEKNKVWLHTLPVNSNIFTGFKDTIKNIDTLGNFEFVTEVKNPAFISIWNMGSKTKAKFLVEPGNKYEVTETENGIVITGKNEKGNNLYTTFPNPAHVQIETRPFWKASPQEIHDKIAELKQSDVQKLDELLELKDISQTFYNAVKTDRDCYYAALETEALAVNIFSMDSTGDKQAVLEKMKVVYDQYPPNNNEYVSSSFWEHYAERYVNTYLLYTQEDYSDQELIKLYEQGKYITHIVNEAKKVFTGEKLEFFIATLLFKEAYQKQYQKELITLFNDFKATYPESKYSVFIEPLIHEIVKYYEVIDSPFDPSVVFMENYENINTLDEALAPFKGKKVYVDVWATWCGPCKQQFEKDKEKVKKLAEEGTQILYISIDDDRREKQWKEMIKFYGLSGYHIRANKTLDSDLRRVYNKDGAIVIPWNIWINENGEQGEK